MATFFKELDEELVKFIRKQLMFFVATAPERGRINLSPKGMDSLRCLEGKDGRVRRVAYLDFTGSGNETAAHLDQNGRVTIMFNSFSSKPKIVRLYGKGRVVRPKDRVFKALLGAFGFDAPPRGLRQIMRIDVRTVQVSCGYAVPQMKLVRERKTLTKWNQRKTEDELRAYRARNNAKSIDGLEVEPT